MEKILISLLFIVSCTESQTGYESFGEMNPDAALHTVKTSCGECNFGLPGDDCTLAIRMDDKTYFVQGTHIDSFGNAHGDDGFCNAIRKAEVQGTVKDSFFVVSYFRLLKDGE